jgi:hypothetical protein
VDLWQRDNQRFREKLNGKCSSYNICLSRFWLETEIYKCL